MRAAHACRWSAAVAGMVCVLSACNATRPPAQAASPAASVAPVTADASYDWHSLIIVPFGMLLKDSPIALHEVLLFRDGSAPGVEVESKECYALEMQPPRFVGRRSDEYRLCFTHDHLRRIEASVDVPSAQAAALFAQVCSAWMKKSPASRPAGSPPVSDGAPCSGREGRLSFSGLLGPASVDTAMRLSIALVDTPLEP